MAFDFKKEYKEFYMPKNRPEIVTVPKANYIAVRGSGDPNEAGGAYQQAIGVLYAVAYTLKMSCKTDYKMEGFFEYVVPPLEGFWWQDGKDGIDYADKSAFHWISRDPPAGFCDPEGLCVGCGNGGEEEKAGLLSGGVFDHRGGTLRADDAPGAF